MRFVDKQKTAKIAELTLEMENRSRAPDVVIAPQNDIAARDRQIMELTDEVSTLQVPPPPPPPVIHL